MLDHQKFIEWLHYHQHEEIKNLISSRGELQTEIDKLLRSDHAEMIQKLDQIAEILLRLMSRTDQFRGLALAIAPNIDLSEQAISILRQLIESGCSAFACLKLEESGAHLQLLNNGGSMEVAEPRFLEDDLSRLAELQLLRPELNSQGLPIFHLTRDAVRLLEAIDDKNEK